MGRYLLDQTVLETVIARPQDQKVTTYFANIFLWFHRIENGHIRHFQSHDSPKPHYFYNLAITCQTDGEPEDQYITGITYAWKVGYQVFSPLTYADSAKRHPTLAHIQHRYDRLVEKEGKPNTFGAYATTIAKTVGIKYILVPTDRPNQRLKMANLRPLKLDEASIWLDAESLKLRQECCAVYNHLHAPLRA